MGILTGYDAENPPANPPVVDVVAFYIGGDAAHVWTPAQIAAQKARYRLPIWVRSNPTQVLVQNDIDACVAALEALSAPKGSGVALDLETAVAVDYCNAFGWALNSAGYAVFPYGSSGNLFQNPRLDGYWVDLPGPAVIPPNCVGVQWSQGGNGAWDNDLFVDTLSLWDTGHTSTGGVADVPTASDVVDTWSVPGSGGAAYFNLMGDGGLDAYGGAVPSQLEYVASANDGSRYHFGPVQTPGVISYPGLPAADRTGTRYFVAMTVLSYLGQAVGVGEPGPAGPAGPAGAPASPTDVQATVKTVLEQAVNAIP